MTVPTLTLNNQTEIPQLGFGVFQVPPEQTADVVTQALQVGYRHIDTAQMYQNEQEVGEALKATDVPREELWITSKLNNGYHRPDDARRAFDETLAKLGLEQIDLFLIHWPLPTLYDGDYVSTWQTLTEFVADGRARSIGVSNFQPEHLDRIVAETGVVPAVNQIEVHPYFTNEAAREASHRHGVLVEAWSPIAQGGGPRRRGDRQDRRRPRPYAVAGDAALAPRARRHRLPEDHAPGADGGELRALRLRAHRRRGRVDQRAATDRRRPAQAGSHRARNLGQRFDRTSRPS